MTIARPRRGRRRKNVALRGVVMPLRARPPCPRSLAFRRTSTDAPCPLPFASDLRLLSGLPLKRPRDFSEHPVTRSPRPSPPGAEPIGTEMSKHAKHGAGQSVTRRRARKVAAATIGAVLAGGGAFAASSWLVGVNAGATGEGQSAAIANLTITAVAAPAATNLLYPGGTGDVVININNPNTFPVTV